MTKKSAACYEAIFKFIESNVFPMQPKEIITDFELGLRKAINETFPNAILHGCWFHFKQALRKKCKKLNLNTLIRSNERVSHIVEKLSNIPLLPPTLIEEGYNAIKQDAKRHRVFKSLQLLFTYFDDYWLTQVRTFAMFISCFSYFVSMAKKFKFLQILQHRNNTISVAFSRLRTTSSMEALNSSANRIFPTHGNFFAFADCLKLLE